ncbi:MAG TPA: M28 family peptidase, partial [Candidatus Polarisedimenticolaceae bacterium]|nr:M28 family peptidase [Candidatus Polarisedimenticolaceae bacterium]
QHYEIGARHYRNVVGFRRGLVPGAAVRVIGAHYDALGPGPAADDNASGVAALLELVRSRPAVPPRRSQYFVAFGGGEHTDAAGTGSRHFARALRSDGIEVDLMLALDGVGHFTDAPGSQRFPFPGLGLLYPDRGNYLVIAGDLGSGRVLKRVRGAIESMTDLPVHTVRFPSAVWGGMGSDHRAFRELGMPGVLVTDLPELRVPWHGAEQDTADKLDYERMAEVVRGLHSVVLNRDVAD